MTFRQFFLVLGVLLLTTGLAACGNAEVSDEVKESVGAAVEEAAGTLESEVGATLESKGEEIEGTLEAKGEELKPTVQAAADEMTGAAEGLQHVSDRLDGFAEDVFTALGTLGEQSSALHDDEALMADRAWQKTTEEAIGVLTSRANDAVEVAAELEAEDRLPQIREALDELGTGLGESAEELAEDVENQDTEAFFEATDALAFVTSAIETLQDLAAERVDE